MEYFITKYITLPIVHIFGLIKRFEIIAAVHAFFFSHFMVFAISVTVIKYEFWKVLICLVVHYAACLIIQNIKIFETMGVTSEDWDLALERNEDKSNGFKTADLAAQIQMERIHEGL